jgi:hypothetical protein
LFVKIDAEKTSAKRVQIPAGIEGSDELRASAVDFLIPAEHPDIRTAFALIFNMLPC